MVPVFSRFSTLSFRKLVVSGLLQYPIIVSHHQFFLSTVEVSNTCAHFPMNIDVSFLISSGSSLGPPPEPKGSSQLTIIIDAKRNRMPESVLFIDYSPVF